ncbi:MAG: hypothetical protein HY898_35160 [Deltaproteobacteria bacterium]|nr:hypothetical protein [Deltaproteobacteria bacterium]
MQNVASRQRASKHANTRVQAVVARAVAPTTEPEASKPEPQADDLPTLRRVLGCEHGVSDGLAGIVDELWTVFDAMNTKVIVDHETWQATLGRVTSRLQSIVTIVEHDEQERRHAQ